MTSFGIATFSCQCLPFLILVEEFLNFSKAGNMIGYSDDTSYRYKKVFGERCFEVFVKQSRLNVNFLNQVATTIERPIVTLAMKQ